MYNTDCLSEMNSFARYVPTNPVPPVMNTFMIILLLSSKRVNRAASSKRPFLAVTDQRQYFVHFKIDEKF